MRYLIAFGTRPEAIKCAPLIRAIKANALHECHVCFTGQHESLATDLFEFLEIEPDSRLQMPQHKSRSMIELSAQLLQQFEPILQKEKPDWVLVQGDTLSAFIASYAAFLPGIKVAHIESGLRSFDNKNPFPEEVNRQLISQYAAALFAPV